MKSPLSTRNDTVRCNFYKVCAVTALQQFVRRTAMSAPRNRARPFYAFTIGVAVNVVLGSCSRLRSSATSGIGSANGAVRPDSCADCRHFNGRPLDIEAAFPGLSSLSSAYAAVRSNDGICAVHDRYVAATSVCAAYAAAADLREAQSASTSTRQS